jgi:uncharacterized membrane protein YphA (DoxX/SURF4 family)
VSPTRRLARPLLAAPFVLDGVETLKSPAGHVADVRAVGLPEPEKVVQIASANKVAAGLLLATGRLPRVSALALAAAAVGNAGVHHRFWTETDEAAKTEVRRQFLRDLGLLGGALVAAADTGGRESVPHAAARVTRRTTKKAAKSAAKANKRAHAAAKKAGHVLPVG